MNDKKAAMEMSVGTIVTVVLLMSVLVLGVVLINKIFFTSTSAIDDIDEAIQGEIDKLFSEEGKKVVIYPSSREISIKQGDTGGFGLSIKNKDSSSGVFSYDVSVAEIESSCSLGNNDAVNLINLGRSGDKIELASGNKMDDAILVKFKISETDPLCSIRYKVEVEKDNGPYSVSYVDLKIV